MRWDLAAEWNSLNPRKSNIFLFSLIQLSFLWVNNEVCNYYFNMSLAWENHGKIFEYTFYLLIFLSHKQDLGRAISSIAYT